MYDDLIGLNALMELQELADMLEKINDDEEFERTLYAGIEWR